MLDSVPDVGFAASDLFLESRSEAAAISLVATLELVVADAAAVLGSSDLLSELGLDTVLAFVASTVFCGFLTITTMNFFSSIL